jgi:hypothetical protein
MYRDAEAKSMALWYCVKRHNMTRTSMANDVTNDAPKTLSVPDAGRRYFDLGRNASYAAATRGDIPTMRVGRKLRVPVVAMERRLESVGEGKR